MKVTGTVSNRAGEILIVEDSPTQAEHLKHILEETGYQTEHVRNGREAVRFLSLTRPDLIISDVLMPEMDGYALCRWLKGQPDLRTIPVILLTILSDPRDVVRSLECGADDFITKPCKDVVLASHVKRLLSGVKRTEERYSRESITLAFGNSSYHITADLHKTANLLLSSYETAIEKNRDLIAAQQELRILNECLEHRVEARTAELRAEIARREAAEQTLRQSEQQLQHILNHIHTGFLVINAQTKRIVEVNASAAEMIGLPRETILGECCCRFIFPDLSGCPIEFPERVGSQSEHLLRTASGNLLPILRTASIMTLHGQPHIVESFVNISAQKQAEEERLALEKQLFRAQKMEAIGTLAGGIAHDFNNILGAIIGYAEITLHGLYDSPWRPKLERIIRISERAKDLVQQILTFSRHSDHEHKPVQPALLIKESLKLLRSSLPATIEIRQDIAATKSTIMADPTRIHQIMMNLCTNAAHAMRETGGVLEVSLKNRDIGAAEIVPDFQLEPGSYVVLTIRDTGQGIPPDIQNRIFEPFFTTKSPGEGTGLGLSVVYGIVKKYNGMVTVDSVPRKGATFQVFLPRVDDNLTFIQEEEEILPCGSEHILFVDDETALVEMGQETLRTLGYRVTGICNSLEALETFRRTPSLFDLIITDMTMPQMTGTVLSRHLLQIRGDIPIILCTGYSEFITEKEAKELGIREFIMKPLFMKELATVIRRVLDSVPAV
ncbi:response regulator [Syntrophus aciditrophicus]|uniref:histidine kinase n=1 Tax=Syntrophus aciditrophicus (strain SB) TaxID=56780 RepID=Q2LQE8_SYNAS|nr:response regulator [Syntrophus aciditrophicus]ABC76091.1 signal transduction histidine kinase [Syntrophus aciditrophicus SB]OPY17903.1 MAG: Blue-light-activated protein [Syntrophus sp. PtaB.Bin075]